MQRWLARHSRFHVHFIPTSSSWLNLIERWYREIITKRICRSVFRSVAALEAAIQQFIDGHNAKPRPFVWTATLKDILPTIARAHQLLDTLEYQ